MYRCTQYMLHVTHAKRLKNCVCRDYNEHQNKYKDILHASQVYQVSYKYFGISFSSFSLEAKSYVY